MSTMCCMCAPAHMLDYDGCLVDHGYNMPDTRETYEIAPSCGCEPYEESCEECESPGRVTVSIAREYGPCDCGSGEAVMISCPWRIQGPGTDIIVPQSANTAAVVKGIWPRARLPERDDAWESERGLRMAEGWGC